MPPQGTPLLFAELCYALSPADLETLAGRLRKKRAHVQLVRPVDQAMRQLVATFYEKTGDRMTIKTARFVVYRLDEAVPTFACETEDDLTKFIETLPESPDNFVTFDQGVGVRKSLSDYFDPR